MAVHLTEPAISKATAEVRSTGHRVDLIDSKESGLRLRITPGGPRNKDGSRTWVLACRDNEGRMRRFPLGTFPAIGVAAARKAAATLRPEIGRGADPIAERKRTRQIGRDARAGVGTLSALIADYEGKEGKKLKSWPECKRRIESVFAAHLKRPLATMRLADLQTTADTWASAQSASAAVRYLRPILKRAERRQQVPVGLSAIVPPATVGTRDRILSRDELAKLLPALRSREADNAYASCMRFLLLTLARREEAAAARWRDIDLDARTWTIPTTKNKQPHVVPLPRQAIDLLRSRLPATDDGEPAEPDKGALVFATLAGTALANWDRETKRLVVAIGMASKDKRGGVTMIDGSPIWTRHDLRRTGATMLGEMGELPDIVEAALNHTSIRSSLAATYNRSRYRPQVAAALQRLADALDGIEAGAGEVISLITKQAKR